MAAVVLCVGGSVSVGVLAPVGVFVLVGGVVLVGGGVVTGAGSGSGSRSGGVIAFLAGAVGVLTAPVAVELAEPDEPTR